MKGRQQCEQYHWCGSAKQAGERHGKRCAGVADTRGKLLGYEGSLWAEHCCVANQAHGDTDDERGLPP
jgi:hypothetical protein